VQSLTVCYPPVNRKVLYLAALEVLEATYLYPQQAAIAKTFASAWKTAANGCMRKLICVSFILEEN